jgi:imidazole glycerol-phosphate synthase subunit HisH
VIALIDYRAGNLTSVRKALATIGADVCVPTAPAELARAAAIIVPGVGHFGATSALGPEWVEAILAALEEGRPLLGICLGMQWLYEGSEEAPDLKGLGVLSGRCRRLAGDEVRLKPDTTDGRRDVGPGPDVTDGRYERIKIPHVGWNSLTITRDAAIVAGVESGAQVYFTHSYVAPVTTHTVAVTEHGAPFAAVVQRGHVAGVQFHPEKSGEVGLTILRNFLAMCRDDQ